MNEGEKKNRYESNSYIVNYRVHSPSVRYKVPEYGKSRGYKYPKYIKPNKTTSGREVEHGCHCECHRG